eukprot:scpid50209/ scgid5094/ 
MRQVTNFPEWYGLPKDHKQKLPLRPVVSACDSPVTGVSIGTHSPAAIKFSLSQRTWPTRLKPSAISANNALVHGRNAPEAEGVIIVTMDVVGLYPSIPIREGVEAVGDVLQQHSPLINMFGLSVGEVRNLLLFVLSHNYFRFGNQVYHRVDGVAMGNSLAPPFAICSCIRCILNKSLTLGKLPSLTCLLQYTCTRCKT